MVIFHLQANHLRRAGGDELDLQREIGIGVPVSTHADAAGLEADAYARQTACAVITTLVYPGHDSLEIGGGFFVPTVALPAT